jgi:hypothetical protein
MKLSLQSACSLLGLVAAVFPLGALAGPYSMGLDDPLNGYDAPIPGFVGPAGVGKARLYDGLDENLQPIYQNPENYVNPLFFGWASEVISYEPSAVVGLFNDPALGLGPVTGDLADVVALGDLNLSQIAAQAPPGSITLRFDQPIKNLSGVDFVVFENAFIAQTNTGGLGIGGTFVELAYVEVSANGVDFVRFPATSLNTASVGGYGSVDPTNIHNLAGKHVNVSGNSWGTPFDLEQVGLSQMVAIRLVDIPGNGAFLDAAHRPIHDGWPTFGSGGFDLDAVGSISTPMNFTDWPQLQQLDPAQRGPADDPDGDGIPNLLEYAFATLPWAADAALANPELTLDPDGTAFTFIRDERAADLVYEFQVSDDLSGNHWTTLATATAGSPLVPMEGVQTLEISEVSATAIRGVEVVRRVTVRDREGAASKRFYRVKISRL